MILKQCNKTMFVCRKVLGQVTSQIISRKQNYIFLEREAERLENLGLAQATGAFHACKKLFLLYLTLKGSFF